MEKFGTSTARPRSAYTRQEWRKVNKSDRIRINRARKTMANPGKK